jgi:hypothetical protein
LGRLSAEIQGVVPEAVNVLGEVRTDGGDRIFGDGFFPLFQILDESGQRAQVMEDQAVCYQVVIFDGLSLLIAAVLGDDAFPTEKGPFEESVEGFALVRGSLDGGSQL